MINIQTIVDNAIESNAEAYKNSYSFSLYWADNDKAKDGDKWALAMRHEYRAIAATLKRLFPDHADYISDSLTTLRVEAKNEYREAA
jgi:hypothetical protein